MSAWLLPLVVFLPALAGLLGLLSPERLARVTALGFRPPVFGVALWLYFVLLGIELIAMVLVIGSGGGARREYAAWKFLLFTLVGSSFTLAGIFLLYVNTGSQSTLFSYLATSVHLVQGTVPFFGAALSLPLIVFLLLFAGFAVKIPVWPLHTWLPDAHTEAPTAVSLLLAGLLLEMGAYRLIRTCLGFVPNVP